MSFILAPEWMTYEHVFAQWVLTGDGLSILTMMQYSNGATLNDLILFVMALIFIIIISTLTVPWLGVLVRVILLEANIRSY